MKVFSILAIAATLIIMGCNNRTDELQQQNAALQSTNEQLSKDLTARDEYVEKVSDAINDVYTSVENVKTKEKSLLKETTGIEAKKKLSNEEVRAELLDRISSIRETLSNDHKRITELQTKLASSKKQYTGLQKMVESLKQTIEERDKSIADLGNQIQGLQGEITQKNMAIEQRDSVIGDQHRVITTGYYITGSRDQLEKMGIIKKEGGFLWGLIGSTTQLVNGFDERYFKPINKVADNTIQVDGKIDELVPKRNQYYYSTETGGTHSMITIADPDKFWKENYLVIVTDKPDSSIAMHD